MTDAADVGAEAPTETTEEASASFGSWRVKEPVHVDTHGVFDRIEADYPPGDVEAKSQDEAAALAHLESLGLAEAIPAASTKRGRK